MPTTRVSSKGRVVIPASIRRQMGIRGGTQVIIEQRGSEIVMTPATRAYFESLAGILRGGPSLTKELLAERARDKAREDS